MLEIKDIVSIANKVFKILGYGHSEAVYQRAMEVELKRGNVDYERERVTLILYEGEYVGYGRCDLFVDNRIVVELKAVVSDLRDCEIARLKTYMTSLGVTDGVLINFPQGPVNDGVLIKVVRKGVMF